MKKAVYRGKQRKDHSAENMAVVRHIALSSLKNFPSNMSLARKRRRRSYDDSFLPLSCSPFMRKPWKLSIKTLRKRKTCGIICYYLDVFLTFQTAHVVFKRKERFPNGSFAAEIPHLRRFPGSSGAFALRRPYGVAWPLRARRCGGDRRRRPLPHAARLRRPPPPGAPTLRAVLPRHPGHRLPRRNAPPHGGRVHHQ